MFWRLHTYWVLSLKGEWDSLFYTMPFLKHNDCAGLKEVIFKSVTSLEVTNSLESNIFFICWHTGLVMGCPKAAATGSQRPEIRYQIQNGDFFFLSKTHPSSRLKFHLYHLHHCELLYEASRDHRRTGGIIRVRGKDIERY